jgi:glutathione S-transferase
MIHGSHACVVVQRALVVKGLEWRVREMLPPTQVVVMRRRFGGTTVPGIEFSDGEKVQGSIAILKRLDELHPEPPLYPTDSERRRRAAEAEAWGSEVLQMIARRLVFGAARNRWRSLASFQEHAKLRMPASVTTMAAPLVIWGESRIHDINASTIAQAIDELPRAFDTIDQLIADGVLGQDAPIAADLQIAASVRFMLTMEDVRERFGERPAAQLAYRLVPDYDGYLPAGTLR